MMKVVGLGIGEPGGLGEPQLNKKEKEKWHV
jgi:hypothetical protein